MRDASSIVAGRTLNSGGNLRAMRLTRLAMHTYHLREAIESRQASCRLLDVINSDL